MLAEALVSLLLGLGYNCGDPYVACSALIQPKEIIVHICDIRVKIVERHPAGKKWVYSKDGVKVTIEYLDQCRVL